MDFENDVELERIDEELHRLDEKRKKVVERRTRRLRQIREKQLKDKEAWMKKFIPLLDKTLAERFGSLYWYGCSAENICNGIGHMEPASDKGMSSGEREEDNPAEYDPEEPDLSTADESDSDKQTRALPV